ncbi:MAG: DivIVA domain-containing protein [Coriobacteriia bacterium]|nr:DivIVA domain-containing protein [Coriobacteriia bacterium]
MKLTSLDIHHKEFRHSIRGYSQEEVDKFLNEVAQEFERLFKENVDLSEKVEALQDKVNEYELQRQTINNTLMNAQRSADDIVARANASATDTQEKANVRAKEIINDALARKQQVQGELARTRAIEEEFRRKFRDLLQSNLDAIVPVTLDGADGAKGPDAEREAAFAPVAETPPFIASQSAPEASATSAASAAPPVAAVAGSAPNNAPAEASVPANASIPLPAGTPAPIDLGQTAPSDAVGVAGPTDEAEWPEGVPAAEEVAASPTGSVSSVSLGELGSPDIPDGVELVEPSEFQLPGLDLFGEREDDVGIEEID